MKLKLSLQEWFAVNRVITALKVIYDDMLKTELKFMNLKPFNRYKDAFTMREKDNIANITVRIYDYILTIIKDECLGGIENEISTRTLVYLTAILAGMVNEDNAGTTFCMYAFDMDKFFECEELENILGEIKEVYSGIGIIRTKLKGFPVFDSVSVKFEDAYKAFCKTSGLSYEDSDK